ncbi:hypothetical protein BURMUCF1_A0801 [Burkholderia multivorans ATCC BAA-247]|nr:hypothetical protein BURMUCF1_A0801 [Burkholderia multivorans ATCC BAA-247]
MQETCPDCHGYRPRHDIAMAGGSVHGAGCRQAGMRTTLP